jgi:ABC-type lipoprotein release transport system permease subunit
MALAVIGTVAGLAGAWALTGVLQSLLYGVGPQDPIAFAAGPAVLLAAALLACLIPARRAVSVEPMRVLREE